MCRKSRRHGWVMGVCCVAALAACKPAETPPPAPTVAAYDMRGVIERLGTAQAPRQLIIRHEATTDMESMAMPFHIDDAVPLTGLAVGDKVAFRFEIDLNTHAEHVTKLEKLPADTVLKISLPATAASPATGTAPATMPAMPGMPGM